MSDITKPTIFVTRRWPAEAEAEMSKYFTPTFNSEDVPLTTQQSAVGFAGHDALAPTVSDSITAEIIKAGAAGKGKFVANYGVGVNLLITYILIVTVSLVPGKKLSNLLYVLADITCTNSQGLPLTSVLSPDS